MRDFRMPGGLRLALTRAISARVPETGVNKGGQWGQWVDGG